MKRAARWVWVPMVVAGLMLGSCKKKTEEKEADTGAKTPEQTFEGRDRVLALYRGSTRIYDDGSPHTRHVTTNSIIEVDEDAGAASARSTYTVFQQVDDFPLQPIISGRYRDSFRRINESWWFDTRVILVDLVGDLSRHLLYALD